MDPVIGFALFTSIQHHTMQNAVSNLSGCAGAESATGAE
jgi:hypothetical protein